MKENSNIYTDTHTLIIMNSAKEKYGCEAYGVMMIMMIKKEKQYNKH